MTTHTSLYEIGSTDPYGLATPDANFDIAVFRRSDWHVGNVRLAEAGFDVAVLEAGLIGSGGSGRNGGACLSGMANRFLTRSAGSFRLRLLI